jgi:hypothetical protein
VRSSGPGLRRAAQPRRARHADRVLRRADQIPGGDRGDLAAGHGPDLHSPPDPGRDAVRVVSRTARRSPPRCGRSTPRRPSRPPRPNCSPSPSQRPTWTARGSTATAIPQRVARRRSAPPRPDRSVSCSDHEAPAARSDSPGTPAAVPAGRKARRNTPREPPTDPQPADTPHEPPSTPTLDLIPAKRNATRRRKVTKATKYRQGGLVDTGLPDDQQFRPGREVHAGGALLRTLALDRAEAAGGHLGGRQGQLGLGLVDPQVSEREQPQVVDRDPLDRADSQVELLQFGELPARTRS